ncbi:acetate kinase [bacterium]|nr:acetate kinase [bacterium]
MVVLVLNCGSSSVKFQLLNMDTEDVIAKGLFERIGAGQAVLKYSRPGQDKLKLQPEGIEDHNQAIAFILDLLIDGENGVIKSLDEIDSVGHRVVHGGEKFSSSMAITEAVYQSLVENIPLAPLHNPANLLGIDAINEILPDVPQVGVFDTAFHQTMPKMAYLYPLPMWLYDKYRLRRYGFHGTSHKYISARCADLDGRPIEEMKIITVHLGNGASVAAIDGGKSVDTSMGFTPLEGLVMGSRCGDIDPAIPVFIQKNENISPDELDSLLNRESGVKGLSSGRYIDMRDIEDGYFEGDPLCVDILEMYCYRIRKYVGAYSAAMGGLDAVIFTAGVGENSPITRELVMAPLGYLGVKMDKKVNDDDAHPGSGYEGRVSTADSTVSVWVIPTNEELVIARDTKEIVSTKETGTV